MGSSQSQKVAGIAINIARARRFTWIAGQKVRVGAVKVGPKAYVRAIPWVVFRKSDGDRFDRKDAVRTGSASFPSVAQTCINMGDDRQIGIQGTFQP